MFSRTSWMSAGYISQARKRLTVIKNTSAVQAERDAAEEGIACLSGAKPEYLMNLIPQDHPDRIKAVRMLTGK